MRLALEFFDTLKVSNKVIILGDMNELGESAYGAHIEIIKVLEKMEEITDILLVGPHFEEAVKAANPLCRITHCKNVMEAQIFLKSKGFKNGHVLLKGSRSIGLEKIL
jgi:UDP-N-acetylmuramoyl-tripeptide--D-alanyl-D-alanine ligase